MGQVGNAALWRYDASRAGWPALVAPVMVLGAMLVFVVIMASGSATRHATDAMLLAAFEAGLPLAAGIGAAALVGRDPATELHLSLPVSYRATLLRRLTATLVWPILLSGIGTAALSVAGAWPAGHTGPAAVLVWLAPLVWLAALGGLFAVLLRSAAAASGIVAGVWLVEQLFAGTFAAHPVLRAIYLFPTTRLPEMPGWWANRAALLATAAALLAVVYALLARPHRLLIEEDA